MKSYLKHKVLLFLFFTSVDFSKAQSIIPSDSSNLLREITVTYQADKLTPLTFLNLKSKDLKTRSVGQEPSFILSETPSITNYSDAGSFQGYSYFRLRGIDQTRINMSLDGVPLNEPEDQGAYFSNYPDILNSVSKIQIQRGVGTSKNGVASYAGSIQLYSPNLSDSARSAFGSSYGSFNSYRVFAEYNSGIKKKKALYARISDLHSDGYKYHSANSSQSAFISSAIFGNRTFWKFNALIGHQQNQLAWLGVSDSLIKADRRTNANGNERDQFIQGLAQIQNETQLGRFSVLRSSAYYTHLEGNYGFDLNNFLGLPITGELLNYAFRSNLTGFYTNYSFARKQTKWISGLHGNVYDREHTGSTNVLGKLYHNAGYKNEISAFTKLESTIKFLTFFADVQYRYSSFRYAGVAKLQPLAWSFINPKAGVSASLNNNNMLYYSIGKTSREPTRNDLFGGNDDLLSDSLGNGILFIKTPETVVDQELGYRYNSSRLSINFNAYYMDFKNEIVLDGKFGPNGLALTNKVDRSYRTGLELSLEWRLNKFLRLLNNSSYNYSRIREQSEVFTPILTPPVIINQEIIFSFKKISIAIIGRYQNKSFIDFANTVQVSNYFLLNARASYAIKCLEIGLFANNLTNAYYYNNGYVDYDNSRKYFVQAPLNYYFSVRYSF